MDGSYRAVISPAATRTMIEASQNPPSIFDRTIIIANLFNSLMTYNRNVADLLEDRQFFITGTEYRLDVIANNILCEPKNLEHQVDGYNFLRSLKEPFGRACKLLGLERTGIARQDCEEGLHTSLASYVFLKTFEGVCLTKAKPFLTNPYKADPYVTLHTAAAMLHHVCRGKFNRPMSYDPRHEPLNNTENFRHKIQTLIPVSLQSENADPSSLHQTCRTLSLLSEKLACFIQDAKDEPHMEIPAAALESLTILQRYVEPYELMDHAPKKVDRPTSGTVINMFEAAQRLRGKHTLLEYDL